MSGATEQRGITERQREIFDYICETIRESGISPTIREIGEACGIGSTNGVTCHTDALIRKGLLVKLNAGNSRSLVPVHLGGACPVCGHNSEAT